MAGRVMIPSHSALSRLRSLVAQRIFCRHVPKPDFPLGEERGMTLLELAIGSFIAGIVVLGSSSFMVSMSKWAIQAQANTANIDQARLAASSIDRQVTSALVIYDPATEGSNPGTNPDGSAIPAGFSLRIYTESNGNYLCEQWRLLDTGDLQSRTWQPYWQSGLPVTTWYTIARNVTNPSATPPFVLDTNPGFGGGGASDTGRLLDINLISGQSTVSTGPVQVISSVDGRDVGYLAPGSDACSTIPPP
jgi:type II secretory pathway pseudopilin PulG